MMIKAYGHSSEVQLVSPPSRKVGERRAASERKYYGSDLREQAVYVRSMIEQRASKCVIRSCWKVIVYYVIATTTKRLREVPGNWR